MYPTYDVPSASKVKKMRTTLCFDAVFFQCCVQLFKSCAQLFQKSIFKSYAQLSKVECTFRNLCAQLLKNDFRKLTFEKLHATFEKCTQLLKVVRNF